MMNISCPSKQVVEITPILKKETTLCQSSHISEKEDNSKDKSQLNIVLDLDKTLIESTYYGILKQKHNLSDSSFVTYQDSYDPSEPWDKADICYYASNGWKPFLNYIRSLTNDKLVFFSFGSRERNEKVVPALIGKLLGKDPTEFMNQNVRIFSDVDTIYAGKEGIGNIGRDKWVEKYEPETLYCRGRNKKDLSVAFSEVELKRTILIDDKCEYVGKGQENNFLGVFGHSSKDFLLEAKKIHWKEVKKVKISPNNAFYALNRLLYAAGVIDDVIKKSEKSGANVTDILRRYHGITKRQDCF